MSYEHLKFKREIPLPERYRRPYRKPSFKPEDPKVLGKTLSERLKKAEKLIATDIKGYDERRLLKIQLRAGETLPDFETIPGIKLVSQEDKTIVLAFATDEGMAEFESRLATLAKKGKVTRQALLFAIEDFDHWRLEDRIGKALGEHGFPQKEKFILDIELWPQERPGRRKAMLEAFLSWLHENDIEKLDTLNQPSLVMVRVRCTKRQAEQLLLIHRDVRTVDLPPRIGLSIEFITADIEKFPEPKPPQDNAPAICILDSGLTTAHSFIAPAVGDARGYVVPDKEPHDNVPNGHGTFVGGLALYGDIAECIKKKKFIPSLRLFSAKIFKDDGSDKTQFVEKALERAVKEFLEEFGCRVFNLSYGDLNKIYDGRHVRGLAYTLDRLSRELGILFVVSTGNLLLEKLPDDILSHYPDYLFDDSCRILDPAPALNAVTVGGLVSHETTRAAQRYANTIESIPVARVDEPSPFTRSGPSINEAIKPDFVEHAGNVAVTRSRLLETRGLGIISFNSGYATGHLFSEDIGTSYAAPLVAHQAARILAELPRASNNLLRALLGAHAKWPEPCEKLLNPNNKAEGRKRLLDLIGYGKIEATALYRSLDKVVTLVAEDRIGRDLLHFYEIPIPESFLTDKMRPRSLTISLAYTPEVRTTRLDYKAVKLWFTLVKAENLNEVVSAFKRNREQGMGEIQTNRWISNQQRKNGTLQVSRWTFKRNPSFKRLFVVVTRQDNNWFEGADLNELYALCAVLDDKEEIRTEINLFAQIRALLQARAKVKVKV